MRAFEASQDCQMLAFAFKNVHFARLFIAFSGVEFRRGSHSEQTNP